MGGDRHGYVSIAQIVSKFNCHVFEQETTDAEAIFELTRKAIDAVEATAQPAFLRLKYYRYLEHVGINEDFDAGYRPKSEFLQWLKMDPIELQRNKLLTNSLATDAEIVQLEAKINDRIENSVSLAKAAPFADKAELYRGIFA